MSDEKKRIPKVRLAKPAGRPIQLRYTDPDTGKEVRITTSTTDEAVALEEKSMLEAKLLLGIDAKPRRRKGGPSMAWTEFRERYSELQLSGLREKTVMAAESRLDIAERILKPRTLSEVASSEALHSLQAKLLAGAESNLDRRAPYTARNYMAAVVAALHWAELMGWLPSVPKIRKIKVAKLRQMKGRPITDAEFTAMLEATRGVVGADGEASWQYVLQGAMESALRLDELMHLHWSDSRYIVPHWPVDGLPTLAIPAAMQKNDTEESIPMLPGFEGILLETPEVQRFGWVFNPMSLQTKLGRRVHHQRPNAEWVGRVISRIGKAAGVVVNTKDGKFALMHDLRLSCGDNLASAGVPEREVSKIMRHASVETTRKHYAPGTVQDSAALIRERLVPRYIDSIESA